MATTIRWVTTLLMVCTQHGPHFWTQYHVLKHRRELTLQLCKSRQEKMWRDPWEQFKDVLSIRNHMSYGKTMTCCIIWHSMISEDEGELSVYYKWRPWWAWFRCKQDLAIPQHAPNHRDNDMHAQTQNDLAEHHCRILVMNLISMGLNFRKIDLLHLKF
jgi:hypothetical protein